MYDSAAAYQSYAAALPVRQIGADDVFYWRPSLDMVCLYSGTVNNMVPPVTAQVYRELVWGNSSYISKFYSSESFSEIYDGNCEFFFDMKNLYGFIGAADERGYISAGYGMGVFAMFAGVIPVTGTYRPAPGLSGQTGQTGLSGRCEMATGRLITSGEHKGQIDEKSLSFDRLTRMYTNDGHGIHYHAGTSFSHVVEMVKMQNKPINGRYVVGYDFWLYPPLTFRVEPSSWETGGAVESGVFTAGRAGNIRGSFAVSLNGEMSVVKREYIVSESEKTVYNPVTNQSFSFADWMYDYETRTYTLSSSGDATESVSDSGTGESDDTGDADESGSSGDTSGISGTNTSAYVVFGDTAVTITDFSGNSYTVYYSLK